MKKTLLTVSLLLVCCWFYCNAQTPDWVWGRNELSISAFGGGEGNSVATDKSDNVYITGNYNDTITFGSDTLFGQYSAQYAFLTKYDSNGNVRWSKSVGGTVAGYQDAINVCTDVFGNAYVTGYFHDTFSFGSNTLTSLGSNDIFLIKYDSTGNVLWAKSAGGDSDDEGYGVSTDRSGNVYITGFFISRIATFGSQTLNNAGSYDVFLAKYDSSGNVLWAKSAGGTDEDFGYSTATDVLGNIFITGYFRSSSIAFRSDTLNNVGNYDIFLAKYDSSGNVLWAKSAGGIGIDQAFSVATDISGNAYLTGRYAPPSVTFGTITLTSAGNSCVFLAKYDSLGNACWAKGIGGTFAGAFGWCVSADISDKIYVTGSFDSDSLTFDTITVQRPAVYYDPMFVAAYDSSGHALFAKALGSGGDDQNAVATSVSGCIYIGGDFEITPFIIANDSLVASGAEAVFVAKLCYSGIIENIPESFLNKEFILYPNPFNDKLNISAESNGKMELTLFDITSRVLLRRSFTNQATINTEHLARGIYFYEVKNENGLVSRGKVVKD